MSKDYRESRSLIWVYRGAENPKGAPSSSGGVTMPLDSGSFLGLKRATEDDSNEIAGREGPSQLFRTGYTTEGKLKQKRARPDFCLWTLANYFGSASAESAGAGAYKHTISPLDGPDHVAFTLCQRRGESVMKERYSHNLIKGFTLSLGESWVGVETEVIGAGKRDVNYLKDVVQAAENATALTLAANAVEGDNAAERLENARLVRVKKCGEQQWTTVAATAVSGATPAVIEITPPGSGAGNINYEIYYHPAEASYFNPPATLDESPLRLAEARVVLDGHFDGSDVLGGIDIGSDLISCEVSGQNEIAIEHVPDGSGALFAAQSHRIGRDISIKTTRRFRDIVRQVHADDNENISALLRIRGAEIPGSGGVNYGLDLIFPCVGIVDAPIIVKDKVLAEEGDLRALVDPVYGVGRVIGWNTVSQYL